MGENVEKNIKETHDVNDDMIYKLIILYYSQIQDSFQILVTNYEKRHQLMYFDINTGLLKITLKYLGQILTLKK